MIGIIGAMDIEVEGLISAMGNKEEKKISGIVFHSGKIGDKECVVAKCGVGKVNAAVCTQTMILEYQPECIINTGIGGATSLETKIGDVVIATEVVQHDMDTTALGDAPATLFLHNGEYDKIPCDKALSEKIISACKSCGIEPRLGIVATGDRFIAGNGERIKLNKSFGAIVCEMEGGSIGQVCFINDMPFTILRSISDSMSDEEDSVEYMTFCKSSAQKSVTVLKKFLTEQ